MDTIICTTTSSNYIQYWETFFRSLTSNNSNFFILIECINFNKEDKKFFESILKKYRLENKIEKIFTVPNVNSLFEIRGYATNRRAYLLRNALSYNPKNIVYVDINTIFLEGFFKLINNKNSISSFIYDYDHPCSKATKNDHQNAFKLAKYKRFKKYIGPLGSILKGVCLAGFQFYKIDDNVKEMIKEYADLVSKKNLQWWTDQEALGLLILKYKKKIKFSLFNDDYIGLSNFLTLGIFCICSKNGRENLYNEYSYLLLNNKKSAVNLFSDKSLFELSFLKKAFNRFIFNKLSFKKILNLKKIYFNNLLNKFIFFKKKYIYKKVIKKIEYFQKDSMILVTCRYLNSSGIFNNIRYVFSQDFLFFDVNYFYLPSKTYLAYKSKLVDYLLFSPEEFFDGFNKN